MKKKKILSILLFLIILLISSILIIILKPDFQQYILKTELKEIRINLENSDKYSKITNNISRVGNKDIESQFKYLYYGHNNKSYYIDIDQNFTIGIPKKILTLEDIKYNDTTLLIESLLISSSKKKNIEYLKLPNIKNGGYFCLKKSEQISSNTDKRKPFYFTNETEKKKYIKEKNKMLNDNNYAISHGIFTTKFYEKNLKDIQKTNTKDTIIYSANITQENNPFTNFNSMKLEIEINKKDNKIIKETLIDNNSVNMQIIYYKYDTKNKINIEDIPENLEDRFKYYIQLLQ